MTSNLPAIARPDLLLRAEAGLSLVVACIAYQYYFPHHWTLFALAFFAPDISLLGYVVGRSVLAPLFYNLAHNAVFPLLLAIVSFSSSSQAAGEIALIWIAHISFDRLAGYGLKYPRLFRFTHIQSAASPAGAPADAK